MQNEVFGYIFCIIMTVVLFGVIWGISSLLSIFTDKMFPETDEE